MVSVAALGRCGQADDVPRLYLTQDALELDSREVMALVDDDVAILRDEIGDGSVANETLDHRDVDLSCRRSLGTPNLADGVRLDAEELRQLRDPLVE